MKTCSDCRHCIMKDEGYSNYTVEGTTVYCGLQLHPDGPFDNWYGEDTRLHQAEVCPRFYPGECYKFFVDDCIDDLSIPVPDILDSEGYVQWWKLMAEGGSQ